MSRKRTAQPDVLPPPPVDCNWEVLTDSTGHQFYLTWPLDKTLGDMAVKVLGAMYDLVYPAGHPERWPQMPSGQLKHSTENTAEFDKISTTA